MIRVVNATLGYGDTPILKDVNIEFRDGVTIVIGENGSGKTTLCKSISGLLKPISGEILVDDRDLYIDQEAMKKVVYVHESPVILRKTVWENIIYGLRVRGLDLEEAYKLVKEFKLENILDEDARKMSAGYKKLISILRALAIEPEHLVLDEPFNHLDQRFKSRLIERLTELGRDGHAIILTTHQRDILDISKFIYELRDGGVAIIK